MLTFARTWADRLIGLSAVFGTLGLLGEVGVIIYDVIGRALGSPLYGSQDLITMTMVILVFGGMAICDRRGGHVAVDLFEAYLPRWFNRSVDVASALIGAAIFLAMAWAVNDSAKISAMLNLQTNLLPLKKLWFQNALSILALVTALGMFLRAIELAFAGRDVQKEVQL